MSGSYTLKALVKDKIQIGAVVKKLCLREPQRENSSWSAKKKKKMSVLIALGEKQE